MHDGLDVRAVAAADEQVVGIGGDGDQVAAEDRAQTLGERERIAPSLPAVHADDDGLEHDVLLSRKGL
jgi:hypothetical protein